VKKVAGIRKACSTNTTNYIVHKPQVINMKKQQADKNDKKRQITEK
jgi:hypothetical protein